MKKTIKGLLAFILTVCMLATATLPSFAAADEEYICELRLVYADSYREACSIIKDSEFHDYKVYRENLNEGTDEIGVYLAYKTTTNIEDAITDIAVMQMNGGYREGNYQQMIKKSEQEYFAMAQIYKEAINHWKAAYNKGEFLAKAAYRQLNFYTVKDKTSSYNEKLFGDILLGGVDLYALATMFFQGNSYALNNIRSLISMGVAYDYDNERYYLTGVSDEVEKFNSDRFCYDNSQENFEILANLIAPTIVTFRDMFHELAANEDKLNYEDDTLTSLEIKYMEYAGIAEMMKKVDYLGGKNLYQFCYDFEYEDRDDFEFDHTTLYPLIGALNPGQLAMTKAFHYYDVVRYGLGVIPEATITAEIDKVEQKYKDNPFDIYTGVDRSIYEGSFALTSAAYREDAYTQGGLAEALFGEKLVSTSIALAAGTVGSIMVGTALILDKGFGLGSASSPAVDAGATVATTAQTETVAHSISTAVQTELNGMANNMLNMPLFPGADETMNQTVNQLLQTYMYPNMTLDQINAIPMWDRFASVDYLHHQMQWGNLQATGPDQFSANIIVSEINNAREGCMTTGQTMAEQTTQNVVTSTSSTISWGAIGIGALYIVGGALMIYSAVTLIMSIHRYYNPIYDDVPVAMVDLVRTIDGDRYIKYDVVYEAEAQNGGEYSPGDTNAYTGYRWNALYYTKSYEAGKPLLAEFDHSSRNNVPDDDCAPIHGFGDVICFDLNRYQRDDFDAVYISVEQSEKQKSAVADVPELVGSVFSAGWALLAGGIGALAGIGATVGTQAALKKKKSGAGETPEA